MPEEISLQPVRKDFTEKELSFLRCPACGALSRPHVLWFDEYYNEEFFRFETSMNIAQSTDVLVTVGTSGATTLPNQILHTVIDRGGLVIDINPESNSFAKLATSSGGWFLTGPSGKILPELLKISE